MDAVGAVIGILIGALVAWILPWPFSIIGYLIVAVIGIVFLVTALRSARGL